MAFVEDKEEDLEAVQDCEHLEKAVLWLRGYTSGAFHVLYSDVVLCYDKCSESSFRLSTTHTQHLILF